MSANLVANSQRDGTSGSGLGSNPQVSRRDELNAEPSVLLVGVDVPRYRWRLEAVKRHEKLDGGVVVSDQVLEQEEVRIPAEVAEQPEKVTVSTQCVAKWAALASIVPAEKLIGVD